MTREHCCLCPFFNKSGYCQKHFGYIRDITSCTANREVTDSCFATIPREDGHTVFGKKDEAKPQEQRTYIARDLSYTDFLKNLRKSVVYSNPGGDYAMGFYHGWITACGAALATLGIDPFEK